MQWFTEFMELFLSVWELKLWIFICLHLWAQHCQLLAQKGQLFPGLLVLHRGPSSLFLSAIRCHSLVVSSPVPDSHKVPPRNPMSPRSCSVVMCVGVLEPKCSELEVSAKTPGGNRSGPCSREQVPRWAWLLDQTWLTCRLGVGDAMLGQHTFKSFNLLWQFLMCLKQKSSKGKSGPLARGLSVSQEPSLLPLICTLLQLSKVSNSRTWVPPSCCVESFSSWAFK